MDHPLDDVVHRRLLRVPDYQRGYAWERQHLEEFWEDLLVLRPGNDHYTGTVVLLGRGRDAEITDDRGDTREPADIVDGQQRLTTITILLNELRRALADAGKDTQADAIRDKYISFPKDSRRLPILQLGRDIDQFWRQAILELEGDAPIHRTGRLQSEHRLAEARGFFADRIREVAGNGRDAVSTLRELRTKVTDRLRFTLYEVEDDAQVGVIFETLNDRGKPLTELEKVKNYLMFLASGLDEGPRETLTSRINEAWSDIYRLLMAADITGTRQEDRFLRAHWLMAHDPIRRHWDGTTSIKEKYSRHDYWLADSEDAHILEDLSAYVRSLAESARAFCDIRKPWADEAFGEFEDSVRGQVIQESERLRRLGALASFTPLLMAVRLRFRGDGQLYREVAELCERFAFRVYGVRESRADTGQGRLFRLAHDTHRNEVSPTEIIDRLHEAIASWCPRTRFERELTAEGDERNWFRWGSLRYFLYEYEEHLTGHRRVKKDWEQVAQQTRDETIEHILPQTPRRGEWTEFDEEDRRKLTHDLGNLVLTFDNSSYSNRSFAAKRGRTGDRTVTEKAPPSYANSPLMQEQELASFDEWTPATVRERHQKLVGWAKQRWGVTGDEPLDPERDVNESDLEDADRPISEDPDDA